MFGFVERSLVERGLVRVVTNKLATAILLSSGGVSLTLLIYSSGSKSILVEVGGTALSSKLSTISLPSRVRLVVEYLALALRLPIFLAGSVRKYRERESSLVRR